MAAPGGIGEPTAQELSIAKTAGWWWANKVRRTAPGSIAIDEAESDARYALFELMREWRSDADARAQFGTREAMIRTSIRRRTVDVYRKRAGRQELARAMQTRHLDEPIADDEATTVGDLIADPSQDTERSALALLDLEAYAEHLHSPGPFQRQNRVPDVLSDRLVEVLWLAAEGYSNDETGAMLFISVETVKTHRRKIMKILDVHSITHAVHVAHLRGILTAVPRETMTA